MAEYIEREMAKAYFTPSPGVEIIGTVSVAVESLLQTIDNIPAADVRPVKRGQWKCTALGNYACSYCSCEPYYSGSIKTLNFCPNCGADMREENNNED